MPVIAVTGATGFIGTRLLRTLLDCGYRVKALVRNQPPRKLAVPHDRPAPEWILGHLLDYDSLNELVGGADAVIHAAGAIGGGRAEDFLRTNVSGSICLAEAICQSAPDCHLIYLSSLAAREPALSWYATSKREAEEALRVRVAHWTILRPPAVYGPDDPALAAFWRLLARGWLVRAGTPEGRFSLVHVDDLADACQRLIRHGPAGAVLSLSDGIEWSWPRLAELAAARRGRPVRIVALPRALLGAAARCNLVRARFTGARPVLIPGKVRELVHPDWVCDTSDLPALLDWRPAIRLEDCLDTLPGWETATNMNTSRK